MLNAAHVGVAIEGMEGDHASKAADYVIKDFKDLSRLILNLGVEFHKKNTFLIQIEIYRSVLLVRTN